MARTSSHSFDLPPLQHILKLIDSPLSVSWAYLPQGFILVPPGLLILHMQHVILSYFCLVSHGIQVVGECLKVLWWLQQSSKQWSYQANSQLAFLPLVSSSLKHLSQSRPHDSTRTEEHSNLQPSQLQWKSCCSSRCSFHSHCRYHSHEAESSDDDLHQQQHLLVFNIFSHISLTHCDGHHCEYFHRRVHKFRKRYGPGCAGLALC